MKVHSGRLFRGIAVLASRKHNADSLLYALKDARRYVRLISLWQLKTIEHDLVDVGPAIVARACEMVGHDRSGVTARPPSGGHVAFGLAPSD
jgi:hypothetical protein